MKHTNQSRDTLSTRVLIVLMIGILAIPFYQAYQVGLRGELILAGLAITVLIIELIYHQPTNPG